ncbi:MAG: hypothetical protein RSD49_16480 [Hafnia sp.]
MCTIKKSILLFISLGLPGLVHSMCPTMDGTYQIEGAPYQFFIQHAENKSSGYTIKFEKENNQFVEIQSMNVDAKQREKEHIPECALLIPQFGMLMKVKKGDEINVLSQFQNYMNKKVLTSDYALMVFSGFSSNAISVNKISDQVLMDKHLTLQPEEDVDPKETHYKRELALATKEAKNNNPAAQLFLAKSSSLVKDGFHSNGTGFWYARNSDAKVRQYWLDKSLNNGYGPAYCYQAATQEKGIFKFSKEQRIDLYKKALKKGNAPLSGVYLADLTTASDKKVGYLVEAANQGSFVAIWRLAALSAEEKSRLPDNIKEMIKKPPMSRLKTEISGVFNTYESNASSYFNVTGKDWSKDVYLFPLEDSIEKNQLYGITGVDLDYNQSRTDCIERELVSLSDYPQ